MSGLREEYSVNDLYIVKFNDNYKEYINKDDLENLTINPNLYYIVEKFSYENKKDNTFREAYKECVGGTEVYDRRSQEEIKNMPPIFIEMYEFPVEYLTEEEKKKKSVSSNRLYYISLDINISLFSKDESMETSFVKKLKR